MVETGLRSVLEWTLMKMIDLLMAFCIGLFLCQRFHLCIDLHQRTEYS